MKTGQILGSAALAGLLWTPAVLCAQEAAQEAPTEAPPVAAPAPDAQPASAEPAAQAEPAPQAAPQAAEAPVAAAPPPPAPEANVLAVVEGQAITQDEIEARIKSQMLRINNQIYSVKKQAVDAVINDRLMGLEASKRGISRQELLKREVTDKAGTATDTEVEAFYNSNKARMGNKPLEEMKARITQHLQSTKNRERQQTFMQELRKAASVTLNLKPPIVEVAIDDAPTKGPANAPVTLVEFSDYQ